MTDFATSFDLTGKTAIVTGAGSGLGRVFALAYAGAGARVVAADRDEAGAAETAGLIGADGGACEALTVDVADEASVDALAAEIEERHGTIDVLVNNAGISTGGHRVHELPVALWDGLMAINLRGAFLACRAVIPLMRDGGGSIVNIASILGLVGHYPGVAMVGANYSASKAGLIGLTRQIAVEYAAEGIRCNAIAPGWHGGTRLGERGRRGRSNADIARFEDSIIAGTPMKRRGVPEELAGLALFLASDASAYLTGQVIASDGGWTAA